MPAVSRKFLFLLASCLALLCVLPFIVGLIGTPAGSRYLGFQYNADDHMVYAAWMRQAMEGRFLLDNRFAVDPQPGLTIHLYFFALGLVAKVVGIPLAAALARAVFAFVFVFLLHRLVRLVTSDPLAAKLAMVIGCFGAGIGFLTWQSLGVDFNPNAASPLKGLLLGHLPNDVWQPEGFVFSSLLTNSLFSVSLCLIVGISICVIKARDSWRAVCYGALGMFLLMNVHSYDVLLMALVLLGLLATSLIQKHITGQWLLRVVLIGLGALPSALWFVYVLKHDPVFQARAETLTFTENFRSIFFGYSLLMLVAVIGVLSRMKGLDFRARAGFGLLAATTLGMVLTADSTGSQYWMGMGAWCLVTLLIIAGVSLAARPNPAQNLILSWACIGLTAPYFPGLFQRKLMMGLSLPWAILAGIGLACMVRNLKASERTLATALFLVVLCATSFRWLTREFQLISANESNTTMHPVYLSADARKIVDYLNEHATQRTVVIAMPGIGGSADGQLRTPLFPDMNPILSGLAGVYTYAGHWSETPDYTKRRLASTSFFFGMPLDARKRLVADIGANYLVAPVPGGLVLGPSAPKITDVRDMGQVVVEGRQMRLIKL